MRKALVSLAVLAGLWGFVGGQGVSEVNRIVVKSVTFQAPPNQATTAIMNCRDLGVESAFATGAGFRVPDGVKVVDFTNGPKGTGYLVRVVNAHASEQTVSVSVNCLR